MCPESSMPRPLFLVFLGIFLHIPIAFYSSEWFLIAVFLTGCVGFLVGLRPLKMLKKLFSQSSSESPNRLKWANKRYYAFLCDPKKRSNRSNQLKFFCARSQKEVESPPSAGLIALTNQGFEFDETRRGWRNIKVSENDERFQGAYLTFKKLTDRVKGAYFCFNGVCYPAGCSLRLANHTDEDREVFLEFSKNQRFSNFLKSLEDRKTSRILNLRESDLKVLYATRFHEDFVIFARNLKTAKIEKFIYDTRRYGFERVHFPLEFDETKVLEDGKRCLLFMTSSESQGILETLTVYRREDGKLEKKILDGGMFQRIDEKDIVEVGVRRESSDPEEDEDYEFVRKPDEEDVYEF